MHFLYNPLTSYTKGTIYAKLFRGALPNNFAFKLTYCAGGTSKAKPFRGFV